jgi:uncharacterized cupredoxin-like copper-binding protein
MHRSYWRSAILVPLAAITLFAVACSSGNSSSDIAPAPVGGTASSGSSGSAGSSSTVGATEKDFAITLDSSTAATGAVNFHVSNEGPATHEFVVIKTNDAPDALPLDSSGNVDETAKGVAQVGLIQDITPGSSKDLPIDLQPGKYVVICNLPGHYKLGMNAGLTVS